MTRLFSKISPAVWGSKRFASLQDSNSKLLYLYFLTNEHMTSAGAYRIKEGYALADLGWDQKSYRKCLADLQGAELVSYDTEHETVYVQRWFKHNPPMNEKHAQGCKRLILELDSEVIAEQAMADFEEVDNRRNPLPDPPSNGHVGHTLRQQLAAGGRSW